MDLRQMDMDETKKIFDELKALMGKTDAESAARRDELALWVNAHKDDPGVRDAYSGFMAEGLAGIEADVARLRSQIDGKYELLPIAYIARKYFGKSRSWLYQRINGNSVRGKVYSLNDEQKAVFNGAVQDIAKAIGSVRLS